MNLTVVVLGVAILVVIASIIGGTADRRSRDEAWRRIALERRRSWERRQAFTARRPCSNPDCPYWDEGLSSPDEPSRRQ